MDIEKLIKLWEEYIENCGEWDKTTKENEESGNYNFLGFICYLKNKQNK